jgi:hypothetical protein
MVLAQCTPNDVKTMGHIYDPDHDNSSQLSRRSDGSAKTVLTLPRQCSLSTTVSSNLLLGGGSLVFASRQSTQRWSLSRANHCHHCHVRGEGKEQSCRSNASLSLRGRQEGNHSALLIGRSARIGLRSGTYVALGLAEPRCFSWDGLLSWGGCIKAE